MRSTICDEIGGTAEQYTGRMMHRAHAGLVITNEAFDKVLDHLLAALDELGVSPVTSSKILAILQPLRTDVVQSSLAAVK